MALNKLNLAVFISGRGSNLQSLIDACAAPGFPAQIALVVSNCKDAYGLERAKLAHIPVLVINHKDFKDRETFESEILAAMPGYRIDLICLAGFMRILSPYFIRFWEGRMINIHPSLLPDYKGLNTHARVLADQGLESGCTVHYVTADLDDGPKIVQKRVPVLAGDTPDSLAARVLEAEHQAYPEAIRVIAAKWHKTGGASGCGC